MQNAYFDMKWLYSSDGCWRLELRTESWNPFYPVRGINASWNTCVCISQHAKVINHILKHGCNTQYVSAVFFIHNDNISMGNCIHAAVDQGLEFPIIKSLSLWCVKKISVSIFQGLLMMWRAQQKKKKKDSYFTAAYLSQKVLNSGYGQTSTPQLKDIHSIVIHSRSKHWTSRVCEIGHSLHNSPKHCAETNKTAGELAVGWWSYNAFIIIPARVRLSETKSCSECSDVHTGIHL